MRVSGCARGARSLAVARETPPAYAGVGGSSCRAIRRSLRQLEEHGPPNAHQSIDAISGLEDIAPQQLEGTGSAHRAVSMQSVDESDAAMAAASTADESASLLMPRVRRGKIEPVADIHRAHTLSIVGDDEIARVGALNSPNKSALTEFYEKQNALINDLRDIDNGDDSADDAAQKKEQGDENNASARFAVKLSFWCNLIVVTCKLAAAITTGSVAVLASTIDSFLDVLSGSVLYLVERAMRSINVHKFPAGKSRLEPLGIVLFAGVMSMAAIQILEQSISRMYSGFTDKVPEVSMKTLSIVLLCLVAGIKLALHLFCRAVAATGNYPAVDALAQDHLNDVALDSVSLIAAGIAGAVPSMWFLDSVGGIAIGLIILRSWVKTGKEQISCLIGRAAPPEFVTKATYVAATTSSEILRVDTVRAYHFGVRYLVEIDIVLPEDMPLKQAHDIGEELEKRIETLEEVERAYVHLDYEFDHKPERLPGQANRIHE